MSQIVAGRYARALHQEASNQKIVGDVLAALREVRTLSGQLPELKGFLENPLLTCAEQTKVIHATFEGKIPALLLVFMDLIASKRRLGLLTVIADVFEAICREENGETVMTVVSAYPLDEAFKEKLGQRIAGLTGKKVIGEYKVDKSIIGGIRVWAAGKLYEYSFNNELQDYKRKALQNV